MDEVNVEKKGFLMKIIEKDNILNENKTKLEFFSKRLDELFFDNEEKTKKMEKLIKYGNSEKKEGFVPYYIIFPYGLIRMIWDVSLSIVILLQLILIPFDIGFNKECFMDQTITNTFKNLYIFVYICYFLDMVFNFFTALINEKGEYEYDLEIIANHYIQTTFFTDLISCVPLDVISTVDLNLCLKPNSNILKFFQLLGFVRFFKLKTLDRLVEKYIHAKMIKYVRLFKVLFFFYFMCHMIGCIVTGTSKTLLDKIRPILTGTNINKFINIYFYALFNGIFLILGNDFTFTNNSEKILITIVNIIALITNANVFGYVGMLLSNSSGETGDSTIRLRLDVINDFLNYQGIPNDLRERINNYNILMFKRQKDLFYGEDIFKDLPDCLKVYSKFQMWKSSYFIMDKFFTNNNNLSSDFLFETILKMKGRIYEKDERIIHEGEENMDLFFIPNGGKCNVVIHGIVVRELNQGDYFGEIAIWLKSQKRSASVDSLLRSDYLYIPGNDFLSILRNFPKEAEIFKDLAKKNFKRTVHMSRLSLISQIIMHKNKIVDCFFKKNLYVSIRKPNINYKYHYFYINIEFQILMNVKSIQEKFLDPKKILKIIHFLRC